MLTATVTHTSTGAFSVRLVPGAALPAASEETGVEVAEPNPITPDTSELLWAAGSFFVLLVLMRYFLFPRLKKGMDQRYGAIRADLEGADKVKDDARSAVADYEKALADIRAEAAARVDAARRTVDSERATRLAEVNARIASKRAEADSATDAARAAARGEIASAVAQVASRAAELATGRVPDSAVVQSAVAAAMESAGSR